MAMQHELAVNNQTDHSVDHIDFPILNLIDKLDSTNSNAVFNPFMVNVVTEGKIMKGTYKEGTSEFPSRGWGVPYPGVYP